MTSSTTKSMVGRGYQGEMLGHLVALSPGSWWTDCYRGFTTPSIHSGSQHPELLGSPKYLHAYPDSKDCGHLAGLSCRHKAGPHLGHPIGCSLEWACHDRGAEGCLSHPTGRHSYLHGGLLQVFHLVMCEQPGQLRHSL